jgi:hypothetical protein
VQSQDLRRGAATPGRALRRTLFAPTGPADGDLVALRERLRRAERSLAAVVDAVGLDDASLQAITSHVRLICRPAGYAVVEVDEPPPAVNDQAEFDGRQFVVERLSPSPFPGDARRCVVLRAR